MAGRAWLLLAYGDDRAYAGNRGYDDRLDRYSYDSNVPNWKRVTTGDLAIIAGRVGRRGPPEMSGTAAIERVTSTIGSKEIGRCPTCGHPRYKARSTKLPTYRCDRGHEFDTAIVEQVVVRKLTAWFGGTYRHIPNALSPKQLKSLQHGPRDGNAIRPLEYGKIAMLFQ